MAGGGAVRRFVFKELKGGDLKKFDASSASSGSGGGARDQRFSPYAEFDAVFAAMFPRRDVKVRTMRDGSVRQSTIYSAPVAVHIDDTGVGPADDRVVARDGGRFVIQLLEYWPPTAMRDNEGRLGRVSALDLKPPSSEGRVFLLIFDDGTPLSPRLAFVTETAVRTSQWEESVNTFFKGILSTPEGTETVMGFKDFVANTSYVKPT